MSNLLLTQLKDNGYRSLDALAKALIEKNKEIDWPKVRSIGVKLGELNRGQVKWWLARPSFIDALTGLLHCAREDLGLHPDEGKHLYHFEDFPELPPLDLSHESPCNLGAVFETERDEESELLMYWFGSGSRFNSTPQPGVEWIHFSPGVGLDFFWAGLRAKSPYKTLCFRTLAEAQAQLRRPEPVCIYVEDSGGEIDLLTLAQRHRKSAVLVCAPFELTKRENVGFDEMVHWQFLCNKNLQNKELLMVTNPSMSSFFRDIRRYNWRLYPDWTQRLFEWIESRLESHIDSVFDPKGISSWLSKFDEASKFDTPRDLITICRFAHNSGHRNLPNLAQQGAGMAMLGVLGEIKGNEKNVFIQLIKINLTSIHMPWNDWIDAEKWHVLTESLCEQSSDAEREKYVDPEQEEQELFDDGIWSDRIRETIPKLRETRLLIQNEKGDSKLNPRFLIHLLARDQLVEMIKKGKHETWGRLCFDPVRWKIIQSALDVLSMDELSRVAGQLLRAEKSLAPSTKIGCFEAIFCAAGNRSLETLNLSNELRQVAEVVLERLNSRAIDIYPELWSTSLHGEEEHLLWLNICWTWSLLDAPLLIDSPEHAEAFFR